VILVTISTSALFYRDVREFTRDYELHTSIQLRQTPINVEVTKNAFGINVAGFYNLYDQYMDLFTMENETQSSYSILSSPPRVTEYISMINQAAYWNWTHSPKWPYSAFNQLIGASQQPRWSLDGWNFMPVNTSTVLDRDYQSVCVHLYYPPKL